MLSEYVDSAQLKELARKRAGLELQVPAADLPRLSACTYRFAVGRTDSDEGDSELAADVRFDVGPEGFPRLGISVTGHVSLQCQRCLQSVVWPLQIETRLSVLDRDEQTKLIASPFDSVLISADGLDLAVVIEDEILAALPMVPVHRDKLRCRPAGGERNNVTVDPELTQRPFADLARLTGRRKSAADDDNDSYS